MFEANRKLTRTQSAFNILELIYHSIVREVRKTHRSPIIGLILNITQSIVFVLAFYLMFTILGARGAAIRGDFLLYLMSGILLYLTHTRTMMAVVAAEGPASAIMQHGPLNTVITLSAAALGALYTQVLTLVIILFFYHVLFNPIEIDNPIGAMGMLLAAWISGVGVGLIFVSLKPWMPEFVKIGTTIYGRANMIASGKMFVANTLPASMLVLFDWNPLFHAIDQARGYIFINYNPHFTSPYYPFKVAAVLMGIGMMGEYYTRRSASRSWGAAR